MRNKKTTRAGVLITVLSLVVLISIGFLYGPAIKESIIDTIVKAPLPTPVEYEVIKEAESTPKVIIPTEPKDDQGEKRVTRYNSD